MVRPEKTVFISYRRKDISWALAVYHYLTKHNYDVFFDYKSIPSGDFEQIIIGNIKARAHFLVILTPTALDRASEPGDWLRREIETAITERRNIVPLFFDGFYFSAPSVSENLTGKLGRLKRYNGLEVPSGYFDEAMERLRGRYLNVTLDAVLHPVSEEVRKAVKEQQVAANRAISGREEQEEQARREKELKERKESEERARIAVDLKAKREREEKERRLAEEKARKEKAKLARTAVFERIRSGAVESLSGLSAKGKGIFQHINPRQFGVGVVVLLALSFLVIGGNFVAQNLTASNKPDTDTTNTPGIASSAFATNSPTRTAKITPTITQTETPSPTPTIDIVSTLSPVDGMTLVYIPAGYFQMGGEEFAHRVYLDAYWIDQTEVTNEMYARCVQAGICDTPITNESFWRDSYYGNPEFDHFPVVSMSWYAAKDYCEWADRRLPTEAEWEKAARGTDGRTYPWGEGLENEYANIRDVNDTSPVGSFEKDKSPYGAYDMAGNVREWVADWFDRDYYSISPSSNPTGPLTGESRVMRGCSWAIGDYSILCSPKTFSRGSNNPSNTFHSNGFRCALSASE